MRQAREGERRLPREDHARAGQRDRPHRDAMAVVLGDGGEGRSVDVGPTPDALQIGSATQPLRFARAGAEDVEAHERTVPHPTAATCEHGREV